MKRIFCKLIPVSFLLGSLLFLSGCFDVNSDFRETRDLVMSAYDADYETDTEFAIGRTTLGLAGSIVKWSDDPESEMASDVLSEIKHVQIGVYHPEKSKDITVRRRVFVAIDRNMKTSNWECMVRSFDNTDISAIYYREEAGNIRDLMIISMESHETAIVQMEGDLAKIIDLAVREEEFCLSASNFR